MSLSIFDDDDLVESLGYGSASAPETVARMIDNYRHLRRQINADVFDFRAEAKAAAKREWAARKWQAVRSDAEMLAACLERRRELYREMRADPARSALYIERRRSVSRRTFEAIKSDPERYEAARKRWRRARERLRADDDRYQAMLARKRERYRARVNARENTRDSATTSGARV